MVARFGFINGSQTDFYWEIDDRHGPWPMDALKARS